MRSQYKSAQEEYRGQTEIEQARPRFVLGIPPVKAIDPDIRSSRNQGDFAFLWGWCFHLVPSRMLQDFDASRQVDDALTQGLWCQPTSMSLSDGECCAGRAMQGGRIHQWRFR
jgi:hypothetical protein